MYGVLTENKDLEQWKEFIKAKKMNNWINVYETDAQRKLLNNPNNHLINNYMTSFKRQPYFCWIKIKKSLQKN